MHPRPTCSRIAPRGGRRLLAALAASVTALGVGAVPAGAATPPGDGPAGFYFGTDSTGVPVAAGGPTTTPAVGGGYGGYMGMAGDWARSAGCGAYPLAWSGPDAAAAHRNLAAYHVGVGTGAYWFMGGPGVDPHYNGSPTEAAAWGRQQAAWALSSIRPLTLDQPILWMDIELPGSTVFDPVVDNGWKSVYASACDARPTGGRVSPTLARAEIDGFTGYLEARSGLAAGVYSDPGMWQSIFGTGAAARLSGVYEWTANGQTSSLQPLPRAWCRSGTSTCAQFFGGVTAASPYAVAWQWSGGGGTRNGVGDFDTIDATRMRAAAGGPAPGTPTTVGVAATSGGYLEVSSAGNVYNFHTPWHGSLAGKKLPARVVGIAADRSTGGYWLVTSAGNVYNFHAPWYGSLGGKRLPARVTGIAATATGYVLTTAHGNVYNFHTPWYGSKAGAALTAPVTAIAADPATRGYWLATSAGNVYNFHAPWYGAPFGHTWTTVDGIAATRSGYVLSTDAGNAFNYHTPFHGSATHPLPPGPIVGLAASPAGNGGYWLARGDGAIAAFGAPAYGRAHTASPWG